MSWLQGLPTDLIRNVINVDGATVQAFKIKFCKTYMNTRGGY